MRHTSGILSAASGMDILYATGGTSKLPVSSGWLIFEDTIQNSPFSAVVLPAPVCASTTSAYGSGLTLVTAGRLAIFFVQSKDEFSNLIDTQYTTCTSSISCESGDSLGILAYFRPLTPDIQSRRVISSYNSAGLWAVSYTHLTLPTILLV